MKPLRQLKAWLQGEGCKDPDFAHEVRQTIVTQLCPLAWIIFAPSPLHLISIPVSIILALMTWIGCWLYKQRTGEEL